MVGCKLRGPMTCAAESDSEIPAAGSRIAAVLQRPVDPKGGGKRSLMSNVGGSLNEEGAPAEAYGLEVFWARAKDGRISFELRTGVERMLRDVDASCYDIGCASVSKELSG